MPSQKGANTQLPGLPPREEEEGERKQTLITVFTVEKAAKSKKRRDSTTPSRSSRSKQSQVPCRACASTFPPKIIRPCLLHQHEPPPAQPAAFSPDIFLALLPSSFIITFSSFSNRSFFPLRPGPRPLCFQRRVNSSLVSATAIAVAFYSLIQHSFASRFLAIHTNSIRELPFVGHACLSSPGEGASTKQHCDINQNTAVCFLPPFSNLSFFEALAHLQNKKTFKIKQPPLKRNLR